MNLEELRAECLGCQKCKLCSTRTNVVFGIGNPNADVLFIGDCRIGMSGSNHHMLQGINSAKAFHINLKQTIYLPL